MKKSLPEKEKSDSKWLENKEQIDQSSMCSNSIFSAAYETGEMVAWQISSNKKKSLSE